MTEVSKTQLASHGSVFTKEYKSMASNPGPSQSDSRAGHFSRALEVIAAIAKRDAAPEELAAQLRDQGIDALDVLVSVLARAATQPADRRGAAEPVDIRRFSQPTPPELVARIQHRPPRIPFVLNGTVYDPHDV